MLRPWVTFPEHNMCFAFMPKVANTSMKMAFAEYYNMKKFKNSHLGIHSHFIGVSPDAIANLNCNKIIFVRNPFDRLVSAWQSKLIDKKHHAGYIKYGFHRDMLFEDFANAVCDIPDDESDHHFRSQTYEMYSKNGQLEHLIICRFENLEYEWGRVRYEIPGLNQLKHYGKSNHWDYHKYYNDKLIKKVYMRYRQDLKELNYDF